MPNQPKTPARAVRVEDELWEAAKASAEERGETVSDVIRRALERSMLTPSAPDLAEFLLERIAEDAAEAHHSNDWAPERILADCAAKRQVVEWCGERERMFVGRLGQDPTDPRQWVPGRLKRPQDAPVLRFLAQPYADHPDFQDEWLA